MKFDVVGQITGIEVVASGSAIRGLRTLPKAYGRGRWRKLKGVATILLPNGALRKIELHRYEAHGIGRRDLKIKRYMED